MHNASMFRAGALMLFVLAIYVAYAPGITGALYYDDYANLQGLSSIETIAEGYEFARAGLAGPLGRPVALASFLPHASGWPDNSVNVLRANIFIHIANGLLLALLGYLLLRLRGGAHREHAFWIALSAALLWAALPILASTSLITIQRMTSLAAFFGLLGLIGFVAGYHLQARRPGLAFGLQLAALGSGTLLAMLAKENGALIPIFALLIDTLLLRNRPESGPYRVIRRTLLALGLLALVYYISPLHQSWFSIIDHRGWSPWERVQTQVVILWEYLRLALLPMPTAFSPFHDHRGIDYAGWASLAGLSAWILVLGAAIWLHLARGVVWPLFAALWFLTGHLLESSSIGLEIYFEHRNYLALYGVALATAIAAFSASGDLKRLAPTLFGLFIALQLVLLTLTTSVWGKPLDAAETWVNNQPASSRAVTHLVFLELGGGNAYETAELSNQPIRPQGIERATQLLDRSIEHCPHCLDLRLATVHLGCLTSAADSEIGWRWGGTIRAGSVGKGARPAIDLMFRLRDHVNDDSCAGLTTSDLLDLNREVLENPLFSSPHFLARLFFLGAALNEDLGEQVKRDEHLRRAESVAPGAVPVLQYQVYSALREGNHEKALAAIERRKAIADPSGAMSPQVLDALYHEVRADQDEPAGRTFADPDPI